MAIISALSATPSKSQHSATNTRSNSLPSSIRSAQAPVHLSQAAIHANHLKYGIYETPACPTLGLPASASHTAATLAAAQATTTAINSRQSSNSKNLSQHNKTKPDYPSLKISQSPTQASIPITTATTAATAATKMSAFIPSKLIKPCIEPKSSYASLAAVSAHSISAHDTAAAALPESYSWEARSLLKPAAIIHTTTTTSTANPHNGFSLKNGNANGLGLANQTFTNSSSCSRQRQKAKNSKPRVILQTIPSSSRASTITTTLTLPLNSSPSINYLKNISVVEKQARENAELRLSAFSNQHGSYEPSSQQHTTNQHEQKLPLTNRDKFLAASPAHRLSLLNLARDCASHTIEEINEHVYYQNPSLNQTYYSAALAIAETRRQERLANHGKILIGGSYGGVEGGVYMTQSEVEQIAERHVRPVLNEITEKANAQRRADEENRRNLELLKMEHPSKMTKKWKLGWIMRIFKFNKKPGSHDHIEELQQSEFASESATESRVPIEVYARSSLEFTPENYSGTHHELAALEGACSGMGIDSSQVQSGEIYPKLSSASVREENEVSAIIPSMQNHIDNDDEDDDDDDDFSATCSFHSVDTIHHDHGRAIVKLEGFVNPIATIASTPTSTTASTTVASATGANPKTVMEEHGELQHDIVTLA